MTTHFAPIIGVFTDRSEADAAVKELMDAGFHAKEVGVLVKDITRVPDSETINEGDHAAEGALVGIAAGAGIGGLVGLGIISGIIPVVGPVLMAGTMSIIAANVCGGAALGGIVGGLTSLGVSEEHAQYYEKEVNAGRTIVAVSTDDRREQVRSILKLHGAVNNDLELVEQL
jgi:hypothetical protein